MTLLRLLHQKKVFSAPFDFHFCVVTMRLRRLRVDSASHDIFSSAFWRRLCHYTDVGSDHLEVGFLLFRPRRAHFAFAPAGVVGSGPLRCRLDATVSVPPRLRLPRRFPLVAFVSFSY